MSAHGLCECASGYVGGGCCGGKGPAAFEVIRDGKPVRLCTRCDLSSDRPTRRLLVTADESAAEYRAHDALGFFCILNMLAGNLPENDAASGDAP